MLDLRRGPIEPPAIRPVGSPRTLSAAVSAPLGSFRIAFQVIGASRSVALAEVPPSLPK